MLENEYRILAGATAIAALLLLLWLMRGLQRRNRSVAEDPRLWEGRSYRCPECGRDMEQGWVLLGKGAIWSPRRKGRPGAFSHIGQALENTISLSLRPATNMGWRCGGCRLLLLDHSKLVK
jgi:hypothetical protein